MLDVEAAAATLAPAEPTRRAIVKEDTVRRRYQRGTLLIRGKRRRVYVLRYSEPVLLADGKIGSTRRSVVLGLASEIGAKKQARLMADAKLRQINLGCHVPQSVRTLAEFARSQWNPTVLPTLKPSTRENYSFLLEGHILPALGARKLCDLTREELQAFLTGKLKASLAWETVAHMKHVLSKVLGAAVEWHYAAENCASLAKLPRRPAPQPRPFLTADQVDRLLAELKEPCRTVAVVLLVTGCRIGECLALRWKHVDLDRGVLQIREAVYHGQFGTPKTASSVGDLPLGPEAVAALRRHREPMAEDLMADALVFANRNGGPLDAHNVLRRELYPACDRAKVPRVSWHSLRHTTATLLHAQGESLKTIQTQLRHSSARVTAEIYTHTIPQQQREAIERLESRILKRPKLTQVVNEAGKCAPLVN